MFLVSLPAAAVPVLVLKVFAGLGLVYISSLIHAALPGRDPADD